MMEHILAYARDPLHVQALDFINTYVEGFSSIQGDRLIGDDAGVICGIGRIGQYVVAIIAQNPGHTLTERSRSQAGMTRPMGYRKMQRMMGIAQKFTLPLLCLIDTPGADASSSASHHNQSAAIADNMRLLSHYPHPTLAIILNQGMSGGAMALAMCDRLWMMEHAIFSVISPEGCARILWRDTHATLTAAASLKITSDALYSMGIVDHVIPTDGAVLSYEIIKTLDLLYTEDQDERLHKRYHRFDKLTPS